MTKKTAPGAARPADTRRYSRIVVDGLKQAPARAMLHAVGFRDGDFEKPQIGIASTWSNLTPCNVHIDELARLAAAAVEAQGAKSCPLRGSTEWSPSAAAIRTCRGA